MKNLKFLAIPWFIVILHACENSNTRKETELNCTQVIYALASYNDTLLADELDKITHYLEPSVSEDDLFGHKKNFEYLLDKLNNCSSIAAEMVCYACIKTYPPQTEILIAIDSGNYTTYRIIDILTPEDSALQFIHIHENTSQNITLAKSSYSGCRSDETDESLKTALNNPDTLFYDVSVDTLTYHAILNYNCCGMLSDSVSIQDNDIDIFISDTCIDACLCNCICDFKFKYQFAGFWQKNIRFTVYLKGYQENEYTLWKQLSFIDGTD